MKNFSIFILLIVSSFTLINALKPAPTETYTNQLILISPDNYYLYWKHDNQKITFEIHFKNAKWALFGINGFTYSDVIVTWINLDETGHFSDRKLSNQLVIDSKQDWLPLNAFRKDEYTVVKFDRFIRLECNNTSSEDLDILIGKNNLIFATGNSTNLNDDPIFFESLNQTEANLLTQTNGPFNCILEDEKPVLNTIPSDYYTKSLDLIEGIYRIYWNYTKNDIIAEVHCKTEGWVAFGFSPNGGMNKSDVFVGWISNGVANFTDRYIYDRQVKIDKNQNWKLLYSSEINETTIFKFTRNIKLCDSEDRIIERGSPYVIFAYGLSDPLLGQDISYHLLNRGSKKVNFISEVEKKEFKLQDSEVITFTLSNVILPPVDTYYYCKGFEVPKNLTQKRHIYKWELELPKINFKSMHHVLIYECVSEYNGKSPVFENGNCLTNEVKIRYCNTISLAWAVGGSEVSYFPEDTGYPIGGDTDYSFFIFEIHYDNPQQVTGFIDKITLKYHVTKDLRKNELGILTLGTDSSQYAIAIPPGVDYFPLNTYCLKDCTKKFLSNGNITVISAAPHTHLAGVDIWTKIVRNGTDIGYLFKNNYYDFNFQNQYLLDPFINITKDDELITHCGYRTKDRSRFTYGGISTNDEMCLHFMTYYPRNNFRTCFSLPFGEDLARLLIYLNSTGAIKISQLDESYESFFKALNDAYSTIHNKNITDDVRNAYSYFYNNTRLDAFCHDFLPGPYSQTKALVEFKDVEECDLKTENLNQSIFQKILAFFKQIFNIFLSWLQI